MIGAHKPRDGKHGKRRCKKCELTWLPENEESVMQTKCPQTKKKGT